MSDRPEGWDSELERAHQAARRSGQTLAQKRRDRRGTCAICGEPIYRIGVSDSYAHIGPKTGFSHNAKRA